MPTYTVVITDIDFPDDTIERHVLEPLGAEVLRYSCKTEEEVIAAARNADILLVQWAPITARVIASLDHCRLICRYGIGVDMIDLPAAAARGIPVCNVPDYCLEEVATHTTALLLALARKIVPLVTSGQWNARAVARPLTNLGGQTLGLLGLGRIGRMVATRAQAFGLHVITFDPYLAEEAATAIDVEKVTFEDLLQRSDYLSLHAPLTHDTHHIINAAAFAAMKASAHIINASRGALIDTNALIEALQAGKIAGAALDVLEVEPPSRDHPLFSMSNVLITPHAAWYSEAALPALQRGVAENAARFMRGEPLQSVLNSPTDGG